MFARLAARIRSQLISEELRGVEDEHPTSLRLHWHYTYLMPRTRSQLAASLRPGGAASSPASEGGYDEDWETFINTLQDDELLSMDENAMPSRQSSLETAPAPAPLESADAPPPDEGAPAPPPGDAPVPAPDGALALLQRGVMPGLRLKIEMFSGRGHKFIPEIPEAIITNLKWFYIGVALVDQDNAVVHNRETLPLRASLLFENGSPVRPQECYQGAPPLIGETDVHVIEGRATFKLKVNPEAKVTSHLFHEQRFRVRIEPSAQAVRCPALTEHSPAFKVMVKIDRPVKTPSQRQRQEQGEAPEAPLGLPPLAASGGAAAASAADAPGGNGESTSDLRQRVERQEEQIKALVAENASILEALAEIKALAALPPAADPPQSGKQAPAADPPETIRRQPSRRKRTRRAGDAPA